MHDVSGSIDVLLRIAQTTARPQSARRLFLAFCDKSAKRAWPPSRNKSLGIIYNTPHELMPLRSSVTHPAPPCLTAHLQLKWRLWVRGGTGVLWAA